VLDYAAISSERKKSCMAGVAVDVAPALLSGIDPSGIMRMEESCRKSSQGAFSPGVVALDIRHYAVHRAEVSMLAKPLASSSYFCTMTLCLLMSMQCAGSGYGISGVHTGIPGASISVPDAAHRLESAWHAAITKPFGYRGYRRCSTSSRGCASSAYRRHSRAYVPIASLRRGAGTASRGHIGYLDAFRAYDREPSIVGTM